MRNMCSPPYPGPTYDPPQPNTQTPTRTQNPHSHPPPIQASLVVGTASAIKFVYGIICPFAHEIGY